MTKPPDTFVPESNWPPLIVAILFLLALYWIPRALNAPSTYGFGTGG